MLSLAPIRPWIPPRAFGKSGFDNPSTNEAAAVDVALFVLCSICTIDGCGPTPVLYGFMLLLLGVPVYVRLKRRNLNLAGAPR